MRIYTRTGDAGETGILGGDRVAKNSNRIRAIGDVDELNSVIGVARLYSERSDLDPMLVQIQSMLFDLGAELAAPPDGSFPIESMNARHIAVLERSIDEQTANLPMLKNFILPGGSPLGAYLHLARSVCRRAERTVLDLHEESPLRNDVLIFLNRLSDWLFTSARTANASQGVDDIAWVRTEV